MNKSLRWVGSALLVLLAVTLPAASQSLPTGTKVTVRLNQKLDTGEAKAGESFTATLAQPVVVNGRQVMSRGEKVNGRVVQAVSAGRLKRPASITLQLTSVGTQALKIDGQSHLVRNAELIGGGAGAGALLGALVGGKKGAAIGAGVGAGAGTTTAFITGKKEIVLPAEMALTFVASGGAGGAPVAASEPQRVASQQPRESAGEAPAVARQGGGGPMIQAALTFSARDQQIVRNYYAESMSNLPPGLAKRGGNLPPGLERQLERNGTLPPGLQKRVQPFPAELSQQLPPLPAGCSRVFLGKRALILNAANTILDLMNVQ